MKAVKIFYVIENDNGETHVISSDKRQMARWYALDYFREKPQLTDKGYRATVSKDFYFCPAFRQKKK